MQSQVYGSQRLETTWDTKGDQFYLRTLRKSIALQQTKVQRKWNNHPSSPVEDWSTYYSIPFLCMRASKLRSFQYRIFHRTIGTNVPLMKMAIKDHEACFFCNSKPETIVLCLGVRQTHSRWLYNYNSIFIT